ncbi:Ldh family oxidoreductase [Halomonas cupida]|uniref:Ldh family oxidoreductase n=1 Tax=Halomonas cupida TaxID=44933 RepID=UPI0039B51B17
MTTRYRYNHLLDLLTRLFVEREVSQEVARVTAEVLVEGDLLGHHTHGVKLANGYLLDLEANHAKGDHGILELTQRGPVSSLVDAHYLLGPYVVQQALAKCSQAAQEFGIGVSSIKRSHHIACLAAYLPKIVEQGLVPIIMSSDPAVASVAPYGGTESVYTPNPIAVGIPGRTHPMLIDVSMSVITNGSVAKARQEGKSLLHHVLLTPEGTLSNNPEDAFTTPPATILPLGEMAFGHKGFALALMVEALTSALSGFGRKDNPTGWGASVMTMVIDPAQFGGIEAFLDETDYLAEQCLSSSPVNENAPVRLPGQAGLRKKVQYLEEGLPLPDDVVAALRQAVGRSALDNLVL